MSKESGKATKGPGSFCVPRAAITALIEGNADAATIGAYLTLACFTDESGMYTPASAHAIRKYLSVNPDRAKRILELLKEPRWKFPTGKKASYQSLIHTREEWQRKHPKAELVDGPVARSKVLHVLPTFDEEATDRLWFSNNIVTGFEGFTLPLKRLKDAGDIAARALLDMYLQTDMETYGGVNPHKGPFKEYMVTKDIPMDGGWRIIHGKRSSTTARTNNTKAATGGSTAEHWELYWPAVKALQSEGFFYEAVVVMNRNPTPGQRSSGAAYEAIPEDADPLYQLHTGNKLTGEMGLGGITAKTSGDLGKPVADHEGQFSGTFAAIVPAGYGAMIVGIFRPRFRPANPKNAGVTATWAAIYEGDKKGLEWINALRRSYHLRPMAMPTSQQTDKGEEQQEGETPEQTAPAAPDLVLENEKKALAYTNANRKKHGISPITLEQWRR